MNSKMREIMETSWREWHNTCDHIPMNRQFERGFDAACEKLMPLLKQSYLHVYSNAAGDHLLDGFRPQHRPIDDLVYAIHEVID